MLFVAGAVGWVDWSPSGVVRWYHGAVGGRISEPDNWSNGDE